MKVCLVRISFGWWLLSAGLPAAPAASFTPDGAVAHALAHNADLAAARLAVAEARGRLTQAGRLPNPELETSLRHHVNWDERAGEFGLTQRFPLTARLRLARQISRQELASAEAEVADAERLLSGGVGALVTQTLTLTALQQLRRQQHSNSVHLAASARQTAAAGEGSEVDALQFDLEAGQLEIRLTRLDTEAHVLQSRLRLVLGLTEGENVEISGALEDPQNPPTALDPRMATRPDQVAAAARTAAARDATRLARAGKWEDVGLGLFGEIDRNEDVPSGLQTDQRVGIRFSIPLPFWNRNRGRIAEADATATRAAREAVALDQRVQSEVAIADAAMRGAWARLRGISDTLLPKARQMEALLETVRARGQGPLTDLLRARERRLELESARIEALSEYHLAARQRLTAIHSTISAPKAP